MVNANTESTRTPPNASTYSNHLALQSTPRSDALRFLAPLNGNFVQIRHCTIRGQRHILSDLRIQLRQPIWTTRTYHTLASHPRTHVPKLEEDIHIYQLLNSSSVLQIPGCS